MLRRTVYGESDLIVTLFTEELGQVTALARGARSSRRRFGGALEPMHGLLVRVDESSTSELLTLREASLATPRIRLVSELAQLETAARALGWVRRAAPSRVPEPETWQALNTLLDALNAPESDAPGRFLAEFGLRLLTHFGWALELSCCVRCGRRCEPGRRAMIAPERGGLLCRACGGARLVLTGELRARLLEASQGSEGVLTPEDVELALEVVERALGAHAGVE